MTITGFIRRKISIYKAKRKEDVENNLFTF